MKTLLALIFLSGALFAEDITDVTDVSAVKVQTNDSGIVNAGSIKDVLANYPALATKAKTMLVTKLDGEDELSAKARLNKLISLGVPIPKAATDRLAARIETLRARKEAALLVVIDTDPARAKAKMDELLAKGVPISAATQAAVNAKAPVSTPVNPTPEPADGL